MDHGQESCVFMGRSVKGKAMNCDVSGCRFSKDFAVMEVIFDGNR